MTFTVNGSISYDGPAPAAQVASSRAREFGFVVRTDPPGSDRLAFQATLTEPMPWIVLLALIEVLGCSGRTPAPLAGARQHPPSCGNQVPGADATARLGQATGCSLIES